MALNHCVTSKREGGMQERLKSEEKGVQRVLPSACPAPAKCLPSAYRRQMPEHQTSPAPLQRLQVQRLECQRLLNAWPSPESASCPSEVQRLTLPAPAQRLRL